MAKIRNSQYPKAKRLQKRGGIVNRFHQEMRDYMAREGITQAEFAERAGVSQSTISRILNAKQSPTVEVVDNWLRLCRKM